MMTLDERARDARTALLERAREVAHERARIVQPVDHRPRRFGLGVAAVALVGLVVIGIVWVGVDRDGSAPTGPAEFGISERPLLRDDTIVAALVSSSGDVVVIVRSLAGFEGRLLSVGAGAPVVDVDGVPGPRWMFDGRTIEFVAGVDGSDQVVRVDVYTGRVTTQPFREVEVDATDQADTALDFMRGAEGSTVRVVRRDGARWWQFSSIRDGGSADVVPFGSVVPLAPAPHGVVVSTDGRIAIRSDDGTLTDVDTAPFGADDISAAAYAPGPRLLLGTRQGTIVDGPDHVTTSTGWPVTALAWGDDSDTVVAETSSQGRHGFHVCELVSRACVDLAIERVDLVGLVRGSARPADADQFTGIWPETTSAQAARVNTTTETWRLDPDTVATRFATDVLGWSDPIVGSELGSPLLPWSSSFEVKRETAGPTVNVMVSQLAGNDGWVVTHVSSPTPSFSYGYQDNEVSVAVDPMDAERATVIITVNGKPYTSTATRGEPDFADVTIRVDGGIDSPASALVLLEDDQQRIFAAYSAFMTAGLEQVAIG
jgi:hypothetical protein